ncbi:MAG: hypothetical protein LWW98_03710 [Deltaproteobacteria bacterium]|nr:hypothetical protein [Deltaproteobacteria bacterium]
MESVYIETTIVSYLVARPNRDLLVATHQQITQVWWIERSTEAVEKLTRSILAKDVIPTRAVRDAAHISVAAVNNMDYLFTWNCKHLANAQIMRVCQRRF